MDSVTELQQQLVMLCSHFYATIGTLQRDAPSASVEGEPLLASPPAQEAVAQQTQAMAKQVVQTAQNINKLLKELPDILDTQQAQLSQIEALQQQHKEAGAALETTVTLAKQQLEVLQDSFAEVADQQIRRDNQ